MTPAQIATLKAAIAADPTMSAYPNTSDGAYDLAQYLNATSNPAVSIWKPDVSPSAMAAAVDWTAYAALTAAKQNAYLALTQGPVDATSASVRSAFSSIFGAGATLTALSALAQRTASRLEAVFTTSNVCSVYGQMVGYQDVQQARNS